MKRLYILFFIVAMFFSFESIACTNFLLTKGATSDGSTMITYSADAHVLFGELYYQPARDYPEGAMIEIIEWDTQKKLGKIKQVRHTYSVVGNMNEHQVSIGETTYGGRKELSKFHSGIIDYGSLMYITLQRAKTAREAIEVMGNLVAEYGYYSSGESISVADPNEVWIFEIIGKGEGEKGAVWVALKIPDGYVSAHANQARITTFPLNDKENCLYAEDVISFAKDKGWYDGKDKDFSFSDVYAPVDFGGARFCEMRVWAFFRSVNGDMSKYEDYAAGEIKHGGKHDFASNRMPLWIKPDNKINVQQVMNFMRDHLEGTKFDMTKDIGAGPFEIPYRWRPLTWEANGKKYCNERATATQQTGFSFVAQARNWLPDPIGGIFWFSVDDANTSVYVPMYCGITRVPETYAQGNGDLLDFNWNSAFWVFNWVSNWTYLRYNYIVKDVKIVQKELEDKFIAFTPAIDMAAKELYKKDRALGIEFITDYSVNQGNNTVKRWTELGKFLMVKYIDGNIKKEKNGKFERTETGYPVSPNQPGYPEWWYKEIIKQTGNKFEVKGSSH
ncbi:MAG: C69 family dipeptidase [Bacteroidota bacterium]|nr:C69 family dipeptidase [Bacteroidota bacterium]